MTRRSAALLVTAALAASCAHAAPPDVLRRDAALVLERKARAVANPTPGKIAGAVEAKAQLVRDLCCYEAPTVDAGGDVSAD